ncbi:MAG: hypothetical protein Q4C10_01615 [Clostridia bacterium]|nr:hypothetical protein [Clostridia bacterium]
MEQWPVYHGEVPDFLRDYLRLPMLRRLRDVGMNCGCEYTSFPRFRVLEPYSRFDHSVGVALIVWHFTGDAAQAVAGLLHDVATPVFAHVVDFMRGDYMNQEATEAGTEAMIAGFRELQALLERDGLATGDVCDYHRYPIADNDSPRLSADRLEYTLGNSVNFGLRSLNEVRRMYGDLAVGVNGEGQPELAFAHEALASDFADAALACSGIYVSDEDRYAMQRLSELLRRAVDRGILGEEDLYATEPEVVERLRSDADTAARWEAFRALRRIETAAMPGPEQGWRRIAAKKRCIDPLVLGRGRLSELSPSFAEALRDFRERSQDHWILGRP